MNRNGCKCQRRSNNIVIYQGSHGDRGAHRADVILPSAAYTEESGIFVNTEGRPQMANRAGFAPGDAREGWAIIRALSSELGASLPFDSLAQLRSLISQHAIGCAFGETDHDPALLRNMFEGTGIPVGTLDPVGTTLDYDLELYNTLIRNLATEIAQCQRE